MITFTDYFEPQISQIEGILLCESQPKTTYIKDSLSSYKLSKDELRNWYKVNFKSFPLYTSHQSREITISADFLHTHRHYHDEDDFKEDGNEKRTEMDGENRDWVLLEICDFIKEWVDNIFHDFAEAIAELKSGPVFACITNDLHVLKNLVAFYQKVRESDDIQLNFFHKITLSKNVADLMTDILILLLTDRIAMIEPQFSAQAVISETPKNQDNFKIDWLGSQQEFAELINELSSKGYITLPETSFPVRAHFLTKIFDFTTSKRKESSNVAANLCTYLSPIFDPDTKKTTYSYEKPRYVKKFDNIKQNIRKKGK